MQQDQRNRARSLSADSTRSDFERIGASQFPNYYESSQDFRRKPSRQNSYLEAIKLMGGGMFKIIFLLPFLHTYFLFIFSFNFIIWRQKILRKKK